MNAKDLKKGMRVQMRSGWYATVMSKVNRNIVDLDVEGTFREMGSCYVHDVMAVLVDSPGEPEGVWVPVEHSKANLECKKMVEMLFGA